MFQAEGTACAMVWRQLVLTLKDRSKCTTKQRYNDSNSEVLEQALNNRSGEQNKER